MCHPPPYNNTQCHSTVGRSNKNCPNESLLFKRCRFHLFCYRCGRLFTGTRIWAHNECDSNPYGDSVFTLTEDQRRETAIESINDHIAQIDREIFKLQRRMSSLNVILGAKALYNRLERECFRVERIRHTLRMLLRDFASVEGSTP